MRFEQITLPIFIVSSCILPPTLVSCAHGLEEFAVREGEQQVQEARVYRQERLANEGVSESQAAIYEAAYMRHYQATGDVAAAQKAAKKEAGIP